MRRKILHIINSLEVAGAESMLVTTITHLSKQKFPSVVCSLSRRGGLQKDIEKLGIKIYFLNYTSIFNLPKMVTTVAGILQIIKKEKIDLIHTHLYGSCIVGRIVGWFSRKKEIITTLHNVDRWLHPKCLEHKIMLKIYILTSWFTRNTFIGVSKEVIRWYREVIKGGEFHLIYNFIDVDEFSWEKIEKGKVERLRKGLGISSDEFVLICVARFREQKGHKYLIEAIRGIEDRKVKLLLVGDGELREECERRVKEYNLEERIKFLGERRDVKEFIALADAMVLSSLWEGLPIVTIEGMALKKPVIATRVGGVSEIVNDGVTGILVEPKDVEGLRRAIIRLYKDEEMRKKMGEESRKLVEEKFNAKKQVKKIEKLYLK
jgi:glycosyltransferase involved in cell wall biosynthesis